MPGMGATEANLATLGGMVAVLVALLAPRMRRYVPQRLAARLQVADPGRGWSLCGLLIVAGIHGALIPGHLRESPVIGWLFVLAVTAIVATCIASYLTSRWRITAIMLLASLVMGYLATRLSGAEPWDGTGLASVALELATGATVIRARAASRAAWSARPLQPHAS